MELRHLRYFVALAEELHFGRAAARLLITQPPLSQQIQGLEEELGVQLFVRTKRHVQLTEAGQAFLVEARLTLSQVARAVHVAQRVERGEIGKLAVGFVGSTGYGILPQIVHIMHERYPDVQLTLQEMTTSQQLRALRLEHIHAGFFRPPLKNEDDTVQTETLLQEELVVALHELHPLAALAQVPMRCLEKEPFVLFPSRHGPGFYQQIMRLCTDAGFVPTVAQEAIEMQTIINLVAARVGVSLVPASLMNLRRQGVVYRPLQETQLIGLAVMWRSTDTSGVLQQFLRVVREVTQEV